MNEYETAERVDADTESSAEQEVVVGGSYFPPEILAPAGGREQFFAALNSGADAVFLGLKRFNARARAENFSADDLRELLPIARKHGMKVLVTLNVLVKQAELGDLVETLAELEDLEVDAIIVQDVAVAALVRAHFPGLRLHASTQLAIHNLHGTRVARSLGFRRVVLARELTAQELRAIRKALPRDVVEIEAFCHGSLCYSYSGLCFFSGAQDSRSGNRGECAYTCRKPYKVVSEAGHGFLFSMRDLNTSDDLDLFVSAGVDTLKIEGRKKDAQYVSTVVRLYRNKLDAVLGRSTLRANAPDSARQLASEDESAESIARDLGLTFQRESTSFFLKGRYHENVIDLDNPTHKGARVGEVLAVKDGAVRILLETGVERFDGLRLDPSSAIFHAKPQHGDVEKDGGMADLSRRYGGEVLQFSLRDMVDACGHRVAEAAAGERVDIAVPAEGRAPRVGDVLFKTRSASLRARIEKASRPQNGTRVVALRFVDAHVDVSVEGDRLRVTCEVSKHGVSLLRETLDVPAVRPKEGGLASGFESDLRSLLSLWGSVGVVVGAFSLEGHSLEWFVPRSQLKDFKNRIGERLVPALDAMVSEKIRAAHDFLRPARGTLSAAPGNSPSVEAGPKGPSRFTLKVDRLETLAHAAAYFAAHPEARSQLPVREVIYEPKRMFLASSDPAVVAQDAISAVEALAASVGESVTLRVAVPTVVRQWDEALLKRWFAAFAARGVSHFEVGNAGAFGLLEAWGLRTGADLASDFTLYSLNTVAAREWSRLGVARIALSIENDASDLRAQLSEWPSDAGRPEAILFKDTPLFIAESCSLTALHNGCPSAAVCGYRTLEVENDAGERFFVAHENCKSVVYGREAYAVTHERTFFEDLGVRDFRLDFLTRPYDADAVALVLNAAVSRTRVADTHASNFRRTLL